MLTIPAGAYTLTEKLVIKRSRLVLRGAGMGATVLQVPKSERQHLLLCVPPFLLHLVYSSSSSSMCAGTAAAA